MIIINGEIFNTIDDISDLLIQLEENCKGMSGLFDVYMQFFHDVFAADMLLQARVSENMLSDLVSYVIVPSDVADDFSSFDFVLSSIEGRSVRKREEMMFQKIVDSVFKDVIPLYPRLLSYVESH